MKNLIKLLFNIGLMILILWSLGGLLKSLQDAGRDFNAKNTVVCRNYYFADVRFGEDKMLSTDYKESRKLDPTSRLYIEEYCGYEPTPPKKEKRK